MTVEVRRLAALVVLAMLGCGPADRGPDSADSGLPLTSDGEARDAGLSDGPWVEDAAVPDDPFLIPGTGIEGFVPIDEVEHLEWIRGPQGGYHVFGGLSASAAVLRAFELPSWNDVALGFQLEDSSGDRIAEAWLLGVVGGWSEQPDGRFAVWRVLLILEPGRSPHAISREALTYRVFVEAPDGERFEATAGVETRCCG